MKTNSTSQSAFINLRLLLALSIGVAGVALAIVATRPPSAEQQLAQAGITVNFDAKALPDATKSFYTDHQYDIFSTGMNSGPDWLTIYRRLLDPPPARGHRWVR